MTREPTIGQARDPLIRIDIALTIPDRLVWLLAGVAIARLSSSDGLLEKASLLVRAVL